VITSAEFGAMSDVQAREMLPNLAILARARPLDKFRLVKLLQDGNEVVAVTGDGTNDAPALKRADVGLAMGISGTEVAKEASKIVLLDDAFSTIVKAVHWGRALYENIQRFIQFQLTINVSALVIAFLAPFFGIRPPFTVLQLLWINVIMDTFASIALCSEPPRDGLMQSPPKRRDESIVTGAMWQSILTTSVFYVIVMMALLIMMKGTPDQPGFLGDAGETVKWMAETSGGKVEQLTSLEIKQSTEGAHAMFTMRQVTIFFTAYVLFQVWNMINCRSLSSRVSGLSNLAGNPNLLLIATLIVGFQVILVQFLGALFNTEPLTVLEWALIALATSSVLIFGEVARLVGGNRNAHPPLGNTPTV
jgi:Ca2+-transporting ATPase